jgi:hypothetical protein
MATVTLIIPDPPGPDPYSPQYGPWMDCSGVGKNPLAEIVQQGTGTDIVQIQTGASNADTTAKAKANGVATLAGNSKTPATITDPIAFCRAVRMGGQARGLTASVAPTNTSVAQARNGAAARVSANNDSQLSVPNNTLTPVTGWTAVENGGALDPASGVYTASATDSYQLSAQLGYNPGLVQEPQVAGFLVLIQRSTDQGVTWTTIAQGQDVFTGAANAPCFPNVTLLSYPLNSGDLVRVAAIQESGNPSSLWPVAAANLFSVSLAN